MRLSYYITTLQNIKIVTHKNQSKMTTYKLSKEKKAHKELIPYRMDYNTVVFIDPDQDIKKQVERYRKRLELDRKNY